MKKCFQLTICIFILSAIFTCTKQKAINPDKINHIAVGDTSNMLVKKYSKTFYAVGGPTPSSLT